MDNVISLEDLFHKRLFSVPDYQRGYAWGPEQITDFLDDLEILSPERFHYTGTVVLHRRAERTELEDEGGNTYAHVDIVDGQQRLTTIVLLLDAIQKTLRTLMPRPCRWPGESEATTSLPLTPTAYPSRS